MSDEIKCQRSGCSGPIVDGVCEDCGRPPVGKSILSEHSKITKASTTYTTGTVNSSRTSKRRTSRSSSRSSSKRRKALGGGLVSLPEQASQDPLKFVIDNPEVPERKRRCPSCDSKVTRVKGFCPKCGQQYDFNPSLKSGDIVNEKFEIKGPIAFGGLGWIYLAWDKVLSRWVIFKGLLNANDEASVAAAVAERQFLAAVKHPKIVGIYDFVHNGREGFIVMEYVGGETIHRMRKKKGIMPVEEAISYILGILPAFSYLHTNGLVYCDFKPDNFMREGDDVKLIDMGGVRKINDPDGDIYGTKGYMAPEANDNPDEVSDLYTIGRALAVLTMDFKHYSVHENSLPTPEEQPVLAKNESLYRFLLRATHLDPDQRFQTADEMFEQLYGVLREIVALKEGPKPSESQVFTYDNLTDPDNACGIKSIDVIVLPTLKIEPKDIAANELLRLSSVNDSQKRVEFLGKLSTKFNKKSVEARLRYADALITVNEFDKARYILNELYNEDEFDWRIQWYRGKVCLAEGDGQTARNEFGKVYFEMPGEIAPKLAIGFASEQSGNIEEAISFYERVAMIDPNYTTACFGAARCFKNKKEISKATDALDRVPANHSLYTLARIEMAKILISHEPSVNKQVLHRVSSIIESISFEGKIIHQISAKVLTHAFNLINCGTMPETGSTLLGCEMKIDKLRKGAEQEYRKAAKLALDKHEKIFWIDLANKVRPITII